MYNYVIERIFGRIYDMKIQIMSLKFSGLFFELLKSTLYCTFYCVWSYVIVTQLYIFMFLSYEWFNICIGLKSIALFLCRIVRKCFTTVHSGFFLDVKNGMNSIIQKIYLRCAIEKHDYYKANAMAYARGFVMFLFCLPLYALFFVVKI